VPVTTQGPKLRAGLREPVASVSIGSVSVGSELGNDTPSVVDTDKLRNEQCQANADRRHERSLVLLLRQHEDGEHQLSRQERLDEDAADDRGRAGERRADIKVCGKEHLHDVGREDGACDLGDEQEESAHVADASYHHHSKGDSWVE